MSYDVVDTPHPDAQLPPVGLEKTEKSPLKTAALTTRAKAIS
jgi:hypothetical protein